MSRRVQLTFAFFFVALAVRVICFYTVYGTLRHGSAAVYGSAAIGLYRGEGLTIHPDEERWIQEHPDNRSGDFLSGAASDGRELMTEFLPGPAFALWLTWELVPAYNFSTYLLLQACTDSILIGLLYFVFERYNRVIAFVVCALMAINLATVKRTLMMGYDFWPQFTVMVTVIGIAISLQRRGSLLPLLVAGVLAGVSSWSRDITTFLPFMVVPAIAYGLRKEWGLTGKATMVRILAYASPVLFSILLLAWFRYEISGNLRPTRSTFWHSFFAGVGQFSNPYGLENNDGSVWEFGKRLNPQLGAFTLSEMYKHPDSPYEETLRMEARIFIMQHPGVFLRNIFYRIAIMISPLLYTDGDFIPRGFSAYLFPIGILLIFLWILGMVDLRAQNTALFWLVASVYAYFFAAFGWFYVVGRVILPFFFLSIIVYMFGLASLGRIRHRFVEGVRWNLLQREGRDR